MTGANSAARDSRSIGSVSVGDEIPSTTLTVTRADLIKFAGASLDFNPIHWNDDAARSLGLDGVLMHGAFQLGLAASYINSWVGDPNRLREFDVRFIAPVLVDEEHGGELTLSGKVRKVSVDSGEVVIVLTATSDGAKVFGRAVATVFLG